MNVLDKLKELFPLNRFLTLSMSINVVDKFKELFPLNSFLTLPMSINVVDKFKELFPLNIFLTLSMSWTSSKNCSLLTYTINVLDKLTEFFPPNLHFQFLGQRFIEFFLSTTSWTSSKNCFLSTTSLHYQYLGHIHRIVFFQHLPYTINILDTSIELYSFNIFLTLSISWTHP